MGAVAEQKWPEAIAIPTGFEGEGIELGKGHEFFVGANSFSSLFGPYPVSELAGAIYKGNLRTGVGDFLVSPTGKSASGLSYDPRTDYLYAATGTLLIKASPSMTPAAATSSRRLRSAITLPSTIVWSPGRACIARTRSIPTCTR
jgi:hypothetical protein